MRKSTIYFFIALSLLSLGLTLIPNAFSQTQNIKIVNYSYYVDNMGILDVVGEIQNVGPNTVNPVFLTGSVYSSDGTDQSNSYCQVWVSYLAPQQKAPFYMEFQPSSSIGIWQQQDISEITLTPFIANATSGYQYPDLKITSSSASIGSTGGYNGAYLVNGIIQNTGSQTATNITVVATFYNATGTVVAVGYTNYLTPTALAPSGTIPFQVAALDLNQTMVSSGEKISSYSLLVQAQGPILQGTAPIVTPYPSSGSSSSQTVTSSPTSSSSSSSSSSGSVNNPTNSSNPELIAIIVVIAILAAAGTILALRKRKPQEPKKATKKESIKTKKARTKRMVETLPLTFFSEPRRTCNGQNVSLFKYFLRTQVCL